MTIPSASAQNSIRPDLAREVTLAGFYPEVVLDVLATSLGGETCGDFLVQAETSFAEGLHRHLTLLAMTSTRLLVVHVDDAQGEDGASVAMASSEAVALTQIKAVGLTHMVTSPEGNRSLGEIGIAIAWGSVRRIDLERVQCPDPNCEADHGLTGVTMPDDIQIRVSAAVEGEEAVLRAKNFASALSGAVAKAAGR